MCANIACDEFNGSDDLCGPCAEHSATMYYASAWDCDPEAEIAEEAYDEGLDEEDDKGDWQVLALDRYGDRMVTANY